LTLLPGFGRRCPRASAFFDPASSLDFLQGTFEKIYLLNLLKATVQRFPDCLAGKTTTPLFDRAGDLIAVSYDHDLFSRPTIATTHSFEGLLTKQLSRNR
jgi:hypothetical protein